MKKINIGFLFPLIALIILIFALSQQLFNVPPVGKLLDPFIGAVQNGDNAALRIPDFEIEKTGVSQAVHVFFDKREVPHIYAKNSEDLYFTQGYVTAYLRLWQMDFLSYASAGRLSEIFSDGFFDYDRNQRRIGILEAAKKTTTMIEENPEMNKILSAYTRGVNAYIGQLNYKKMPFEYKLLDYKPEPWSNLKTVLVMKYMANTLSGYEEDVSISSMMVALGESDFNRLFPDFPGHITPVANDQPVAKNVAQPIIKRPGYLDYAFLSSGSVLSKSTYNPKLGSNSWAVSGAKTKSGYPILCSDPHLSLSLPCIWLEMQLSAPGVNVYGVAIPGTPAIIIGFNENVAWGITNGADDVKDWYKLKISDDYRKYEFDGKWLDLNYSVEEIKRKGQRAFYDTVYHSVQGPIVIDNAFSGRTPEFRNYALKWELHNPSDEFLCFIKLNQARNYADYLDAIKYYSCPIQNFTFACKDNTIAVNHQGNMAIKQAGEGRFVLDGTDASQLYTRYIPEDSLPHELNPSCNYVLSANQHPTNPGYPYYYNGYYSEIRANRIKQMLDSGNEFDSKKMEAMQLDNTNFFTVEALPALMDKLHADKLTEEQRNNLMALRSWKGTYGLQDENAKLFELWWKNVSDYTWDEFMQFPFYARPPENYILLDLIRKDPNDIYFDKQGTVKRENAEDIITEAFVAASDEFAKMRKDGSTKWGDLNKINIMHMTNIGAFSRKGLSSAGHPDAINAMSSNWGPSWRMIVELGPKPKAYGIYPGGQSGNIGSPNYDDFITDWNKGVYYPLNFYMSMDEAARQGSNTWILK